MEQEPRSEGADAAIASRRRSRRIGRVAAAGLLLLAVCASSALAATSHASRASGAPVSTAGLTAQLPASALHAGGTPSLAPGSSSEAGAAATNSAIGAGQYVGLVLVSASTTFTMPSFSCHSSSDSEWLLPGLWIYNTSGQLVSQVDVNFNCNSGSKVQSDVICITGGGCDTSLHVNPGDVIEAVYTASGSSAIGTLYDRTQHTVAQASGNSVGSAIVLVGDQGPGLFGVPAVPTFSKVPFSITTLNGFYVADWGPTVLNLKTGSNVQIKSGSAKTTSFTTKFVANS